MENKEGRRNSILKTRVTVDVLSETVENNVANGPAQNRRVSFHNMKQIQEYDRHHGQMIDGTPIREKITDTLGSDGTLPFKNQFTIDWIKLSDQYKMESLICVECSERIPLIKIVEHSLDHHLDIKNREEKDVEDAWEEDNKNSQKTEENVMELDSKSNETEAPEEAPTTEATDDFQEPERDGIERSFEKQKDEDCEPAVLEDPVFAVPKNPDVEKTSKEDTEDVDASEDAETQDDDLAQDIPLDRTFEVQEEEEGPKPRGDTPIEEPSATFVVEEPKVVKQGGRKKTPSPQLETMEQKNPVDEELERPPLANTRSSSRIASSRSVTPVEELATKPKKPQVIARSTEVQEEAEESTKKKPASKKSSKASTPDVTEDIPEVPMEVERPAARPRRGAQKPSEPVEAPKEEAPPKRPASRSRTTRAKPSGGRKPTLKRAVTATNVVEEDLNATGASIKRRVSTRADAPLVTAFRGLSVQPGTSTPAPVTATGRRAISAPTTPRGKATPRQNTPEEPSTSATSSEPAKKSAKGAQGSRSRTTPLRPITEEDEKEVPASAQKTKNNTNDESVEMEEAIQQSPNSSEPEDPESGAPESPELPTCPESKGTHDSSIHDPESVQKKEEDKLEEKDAVDPGFIQKTSSSFRREEVMEEDSVDISMDISHQGTPERSMHHRPKSVQDASTIQNENEATANPMEEEPAKKPDESMVKTMQISTDTADVTRTSRESTILKIQKRREKETLRKKKLTLRKEPSNSLKKEIIHYMLECRNACGGADNNGIVAASEFKEGDRKFKLTVEEIYCE